jgi:hypothetical protein
MQNLSSLKELLLEILESTAQTNTDIQATQQMGVSVSNALTKREGGIVVIQNQNVEIYTKIIPTIVKALRLCDSLSSPVIEMEKPLTDPTENYCKWMYERKIDWETMQEVTRKNYLSYVIDRFKTKKEAAEWLGLGVAYVYNLLRKEEKTESE